MRIVLLLAVLFVAAWLPVALAAGLPANSTLLLHHRGPRRAPPASGYLEADKGHFGPIGVKQMQEKLNMHDGPIACCPSTLQYTTPKAGTDRFGNLVRLYNEGSQEQTFYEVSCRPDVLDQPCQFLERRLFNQSRCVQKRSYSYAMVYNHSMEGRPQVRLDHIQVNSGCVCEVRSKRQKRPEKPPEKRRHRHDGHNQQHKRHD